MNGGDGHWGSLRDLAADPPVGDGLQGPAVAAGQPEGAVGQQVGAVGDLQNQQVASRGLQQRLQTFLQTTTGMQKGDRGLT